MSTGGIYCRFCMLRFAFGDYTTVLLLKIRKDASTSCFPIRSVRNRRTLYPTPSLATRASAPPEAYYSAYVVAARATCLTLNEKPLSAELAELAARVPTINAMATMYPT